jgi:acyl dehydratase
MDIGDVVSWTRTFREGDVRAFTRISGDEGRQHVLPDEQGRLMVQGLLTATLTSKIGGDLNFLAGEMIFRFHSPVFAGDSIRCDVRIDRLDGPPQRRRLACSWICTNQDGTTVMTGGSKGVIVAPGA